MNVTIDRLSLRVPGSDPELARRLAQLVAERLAAPLALGAGDGALDRLRVRVDAAPGETPELLAGRIAAQIVRSLGDSLLEAGR